MGGFISLHRKLLDWRFIDDPVMLSLWVQLLLRANYEDKEWHDVIIHRGQIKTTVGDLCEMVGTTRDRIRQRLKFLEDGGEITIKTTNKFSIITICKYDDYQLEVVEPIPNKIPNKSQTNPKQEQKKSDIKENNINKDNNIKESISKDIPKKSKIFEIPERSDVSDHIKERGYHFTTEEFFAHYESNGWMVGKTRMKDWKAACVTFERTYKRNHPVLIKNEEVQKNSGEKYGKFILYLRTNHYDLFANMFLPEERSYLELISRNSAKVIAEALKVVDGDNYKQKRFRYLLDAIKDSLNK